MTIKGMFIILFIYLPMCVHAICMPWHSYRDQRTNGGTQFSSSTMKVPSIEISHQASVISWALDFHSVRAYYLQYLQLYETQEHPRECET